MAELFWRTRIKRKARKIILALPDLPADIDDNVFIALGTQAAEADKTSKAYDEFLFSEGGYEQMPYEDSVAEILTLQRQRNAERKGRATLPSRMRIEYLTKLIEAHKRKVADAQAELDAVNSDIQAERQVLSGNSVGEDGGLWEGVAPDTTSRTKHVLGRLKEWGVFAIVATADAFVVFLSLRLITSNEDEAYKLSAPAIGVQMLFPHLVGRAIADARSKNSKRLKDWLIAGLVGGAWACYVVAMTILRVNLVDNMYFDRYQKIIPSLLNSAVFIFSVLILVGLGSWVLIRALNSNPHQGRFSRLKFVYFNKQRALRSAQSDQAKSEADLESEIKTLAEIESQWDRRADSYEQVCESAKSVYRRALVNQQGAPEFTTEYLPESKFRIRKQRKG
jgi:hypothetical protein